MSKCIRCNGSGEEPIPAYVTETILVVAGAHRATSAILSRCTGISIQLASTRLLNMMRRGWLGRVRLADGTGGIVYEYYATKSGYAVMYGGKGTK